MTSVWDFKPVEELRTCNKCEKPQPIKNFSIDKNCKGGRKYICRACVAKQVDAKRTADRTKMRSAPPPIVNEFKYEVYKPTKEPGYVIRNDGLKHIPSRGF